MKIPPYWARGWHEGFDERGRPRVFTVFGWSFSSPEEARANAAARARQVSEIVTHGQPRGTYEYLDRPLREEIIQEVVDGEARPALITRNRYGALVLNSDRVLFADIDFPRSSGGALDSLLMLFSASRRRAREQARTDETIQHVERWASRHPSRSFRLYQTCEGLRLLFTDRLYQPAATETTALLRELNADPMYIRLTQKQECFRARLTAKPWRCGCTRPPAAFPWEDEQAERAYRQWEDEYTKRDADYRTCQFVKQFGQVADVPGLAAVIRAHDEGAKVDSDAPLA